MNKSDGTLEQNREKELLDEIARLQKAKIRWKRRAQKVEFKIPGPPVMESEVFIARRIDKQNVELVRTGFFASTQLLDKLGKKS